MHDFHHRAQCGAREASPLITHSFFFCSGKKGIVSMWQFPRQTCLVFVNCQLTKGSGVETATQANVNKVPQRDHRKNSKASNCRRGRGEEEKQRERNIKREGNGEGRQEEGDKPRYLHF